MFRICLLFALVFCSIFCIAQVEDTTECFTIVEYPPQFGNNKNDLYKYITENLVYPPEAADNKIVGRVVVQIAVMPDGSLTNVKILKGLSDGCNEAILNLIKNMPNWTPGRRGEKPIKVCLNLPIKFGKSFIPPPKPLPKQSKKDIRRHGMFLPGVTLDK